MEPTETHQSDPAAARDTERAIDLSKTISRPPVPVRLRREDGRDAIERWRSRTPLHGINGEVGTEYLPGTKPIGNELNAMSYRRPEPGEHKIIDTDGSVRTKKVTEESIRESINETVFSGAFAEDGMSVSDAHPFRVRLAWRIVRQMARIRLHIGPDEALRDLGHIRDPLHQTSTTQGDPDDCWLRPFPVPRSPLPGAGHLHWKSVLAPMRESEDLPDDLGYCEWSKERNEWVLASGFGLLPPPVPKRFRASNGDVSLSYCVQDDWNLRHYCDAIEEIVCHLQIWGASEHEAKNRLGFHGLSEPNLVRLLFPSKMEIITYEELLLDEVIEGLITSSTRSTKLKIQQKHGLLPFETDQIVRLAQARIRDDQTADVEELRSIHVARIEDAIERARLSCNLAEEAKLHKQLAIIQGINRTDPDDIRQDWLAAMAAVGGGMGRAIRASKADLEAIGDAGLDRKPLLLREGVSEG